MLPRSPVLLLLTWLNASSNGLAHNPSSQAGPRARRDVFDGQSQEVFHISGERSGEDSFPSSGASVPNSWLYKFPPWFLPNNPAPEGFYAKSLLSSSQDSSLPLGSSFPQSPSFPKGLTLPQTFSENPPLTQGTTISAEPSLPPPADDSSFSDVQDGDVIIVSDLVEGRRTGRLQNIKVKGDSAFREELVRTILEVKLLNKAPNPGQVPPQTTTPDFSGGATPFEVALSAPQPPPPAPKPTPPFVLQDLGGGDFPVSQGFVTKGSTDFGVGTASPGTNLGGGVHFESTPLLPESSPHPSFPSVAPQIINNSGDFRPSPPDFTFAHLPPPDVGQGSPPQLPPRNVAFSQSPLSASDPLRIPGFASPDRPRSLSNRPNRPVVPSRTVLNQGIGNKIQPSGPQIEHNDIAEIFFRDQQEALLKASDKLRQRGTHVQDDSGESVWIPFIPGIPLPILVQHTLASRRRQRAHSSTSQFRHRGGNKCIRGCGFNAPSGQTSSSSPLYSSLQPALSHQNPLVAPRSPSQHSQPTSIQDIIGSDYDTSEELYRRAKANSFTIRPTESSFVRRNNGFNIRDFARS